ncbi:MAG TPA: hypothetical protein VLW53_08845 [Candidatus Eisenbacteria bacterium]|nr:hypothetical protein [Candidatus Eisenbacteria bacterium]
MTYDQIVHGLRDSTYELQTEGRLVRAGDALLERWLPGGRVGAPVA